MARLPALLALLLLVPLLAGCTGEPETDDDEQDEIREGHGHVTIFVRAPLGLDQHPIWSLEAVPRLVAFFPADDDTAPDNDTGDATDDNGTADNQTAPNGTADDPAANGTNDGQGGTYVDVARGWTEEWAETHEPGEWPPEAKRDWMQPHQVWYEGEVPAGDYDRIRIEILEIMGTDSKGRQLDVRLLGDRLSVSPGDGQTFVVDEGERSTFVMDALIERRGDLTYEIR